MCYVAGRWLWGYFREHRNRGFFITAIVEVTIQIFFKSPNWTPFPLHLYPKVPPDLHPSRFSAPSCR